MSDRAMKHKALRGGAWAMLENIGTQVINFAVFILLARLLEPSEIGLASLAAVFTALALIFSNQGLGDALVQREELEPEHLDTMFWVNNGIALIAAVICFFLAPWIGQVFKQPLLPDLLRVLCVTFLFNALGMVHHALLRRELRFRSLALRRLIAALVGGMVGLVLALKGYGVWSLIAQQVVNSFVAMLILIAGYRWRPRFRFSKPHFMTLFHFSAHTFGTNLLSFLMQRADRMIIGGFLGTSVLGLYTLAQQLIGLLATCLFSSIANVAFPYLSRIHQDRDLLRRTFIRVVKLSCLAGFPAYAGLALAAQDIVPLILGAKWEPAVPLIRVLACVGFLYAIFFIADALSMACGRADYVFRINLLSVVIHLTGFFIAVQWGALALVIVYVLRGYLIAPVRTYVVHLIVPPGVPALGAALVRPLMATIGMALCVVAVQTLFPLTGWSRGILVLLAGGLGYLVCLVLVDRRFIFEDSVQLWRTLRGNSGNDSRDNG